MINKNSQSNRRTNNPYLVGIGPDQASKMTLGSELKRLLGGPLRFPATLVFVLAFPLLAAAGALDLLTVWLYAVSHHSQGDLRPTLNVFECLQDQTKKLCQNMVWASPASSKRLTLYPWHDFNLINRFEPYLFIGYFAIAVLSFVAIGNPNLAGVGRNLKLVAGLKPKGGPTTSASKNHFDLVGTSTATTGPVPRALLEADRPEEFWKNHLLLGEYVPRHWESDPGYFWLDREAKPVPYWLTLSSLRTGLVIVAPQGSGKTASIFKPLRNFMERSRSAGIFYDVKSSENTDGTGTDFPAHLFELNFDATRADTGASIKLNVFAGQTPAQAGERLAEALIPDLGGDKAYFSNNAKSAMSTIVACYHANFNKYPTLVEILSYLTDPADLETLNGDIVLKFNNLNRQAEGLRLSTLLRRVINLSQNKNTDTLGSLAAALEPLVTDVAASLLVTNSEPGAYSVEELLKEPRLVRLALPVANNPRIYPIIGRLVLAQFAYAVLSPTCNREIFKLIAVDEARFFITDNVANGMAQARSNNAGFALSFQTLTQVRDEILLDNIFANAGSKLVMGKVSDKDAERYSRLFGTIELPYVSHTNSDSRGINKNSGSSYSRGLDFEMMSTGTSGHESRTTRATNSGRSTSTGTSQGTNLSTRLRRRFLDSEVREAPQRHAIIESSDDQGRQWFAQVVNMDAGMVSELEQRVNRQIEKLVNKTNKKDKGKSHKRDSRPIVTFKSKTQSDNDAQIQEINGQSQATTTRQRIKFKVTYSLPSDQDQTQPAAENKTVVTNTTTPILALPAQPQPKSLQPATTGDGTLSELMPHQWPVNSHPAQKKSRPQVLPAAGQGQDQAKEPSRSLHPKASSIGAVNKPEEKRRPLPVSGIDDIGTSLFSTSLTTPGLRSKQGQRQHQQREEEEQEHKFGDEQIYPVQTGDSQQQQNQGQLQENQGREQAEFAIIKELLISVAIAPDQAEDTAHLIIANGRTLSELNRLIGYARTKNPKYLGAYILAMVKKGRFPAAPPSSNVAAKANKKD